MLLVSAEVSAASWKITGCCAILQVFTAFMLGHSSTRDTRVPGAVGCMAMANMNITILWLHLQAKVTVHSLFLLIITTPCLSVATAWNGMCGLWAQGADRLVGSEGAGVQLTTGPTSFTRSVKRLQA